MSFTKAITDRFRSMSGQENREENTKQKKSSSQVRVQPGRKKKLDSTSGKPKQGVSGEKNSAAENNEEESTNQGDTHSESTEPWKCEVCEGSFVDETCKMMECDRCKSHFCLICIGMNDSAYEYMNNENVLWCCPTCSRAVKALLARTDDDDEVHEPAPLLAADNPVIAAMRRDLDETTRTMKGLARDFYCFINGNKTDSKSDPSETTEDQESTTQTQETAVKELTWKVVPPKNVKPLIQILEETNEASRKEAEEEIKRRRNIIIHRAEETESNDRETRRKADLAIVENLLAEVEVQADVQEYYRLGKKEQKSNEADARPPTPRPLKVSFNTEQDVQNIMKNLHKLGDASPALNQVRVTPDRNLKEREEVRKLVEEAKNRTAKETGDFVHIVRGKEIIRVKNRKSRGQKTPASG